MILESKPLRGTLFSWRHYFCAGLPSDGQPAGSANLGFDPPPRVQKLVAHLKRFMDEHIYPAEPVLAAHAADPKTKWTLHPRMEELKVIKSDSQADDTADLVIENRNLNVFIHLRYLSSYSFTSKVLGIS